MGKGRRHARGVALLTGTTSRAVGEMNRLRHLFLLAVFGVAGAAALPSAQPARYDLVVRNARIVDGSGSPWYRGDVAVTGDTIVRIAPSIETPATTTVDAKGQILSPGFIDIHTHSSRGIFQIPTADNYVRQGVTTVIEGPDGASPVPIGPFFARLEMLKRSVKIGACIGHGRLRARRCAKARSWAAPNHLRERRAPEWR